MTIGTGFSVKSNTSNAMQEAYENLLREMGGVAPQVCLCLLTSNHSGAEAVKSFTEISGGSTLLAGGTSSRGVMTEKGFHSRDNTALALWGLRDDHASPPVGVGGRPLGTDPCRAAREAAQDALASLNMEPDLIWLMGVPGHEEELLRGIDEVTGGKVPVVGGSAADNDVKGEWYTLCNGDVFAEGIVVVAFRSSDACVPVFDSAYTPSSRSAIITAVGEDSRKILELNGQPAAELYDQWTGGSISSVLQSGVGGDILSLTTLQPLGRKMVGGSSQSYQLLHPDMVTKDGGLSLFANVEVGDELTLMVSSKANVVADLSNCVTRALLKRADFSQQRIQSLLGFFLRVCRTWWRTLIRFSEQLAALPASLDFLRPSWGHFSIEGMAMTSSFPMAISCFHVPCSDRQRIHFEHIFLFL